MKPQRKQRLMLIGFLVVGAAAMVGFLLLALGENVNLFYPPDQVVSGAAPIDQRMRAGGMVKEGSVQRGDALDVSFTLSDLAGSDFEVRYTGILPDLFREGQGIVATGKLTSDGVFIAEQVLAKHDENYMPPELADMAQNAKDSGAMGSEVGSPMGAPSALPGASDRRLPNEATDLPATPLPSAPLPSAPLRSVPWGSDS